MHRGAGLHVLSAWSARQQQSLCSSAVDTACLQKVMAVLITDTEHVRCVVTALPCVFSDKCSGTSSHCTCLMLTSVSTNSSARCALQIGSPGLTCAVYRCSSNSDAALWGCATAEHPATACCCLMVWFYFCFPLQLSMI